jgi:hypothetical protein
MQKFKNHKNMIFGHIGVHWVRSWQELTFWFARRLLSINANIGTRGCEVFHRKTKVQKPQKLDFRTYWSVLGPFVAGTHFVITRRTFIN